MEYTSSAGLWAFINTNGTLLDKKKIREIKRLTGNKAIFVFSVNSLDSKVHGWSRGEDLKDTARLARLCQKEGINFFFILTVTRNNLSTLKQTMDFLKKHGIPVLRSPFVSRGLGSLHPELMLTREDMEKIIHPNLRENHLSYVSYTPFFASPEFLRGKWNELNVEIGQLGCQAAKGFIGISAEGDVAPCVHLLDGGANCGNVRQQALSAILAENPVLKKVRDRDGLKGKCGRCRYKHTCGGCRALAYYKHGDYMAEDPTFFFEPEDESTRSEFEGMQNENTSKFIEFIKRNEPWKSLF